MRQRDARRAYLWDHPVVVFLAAGGTIVGLWGALDAGAFEQSAVRDVMGEGELRLWLGMHAFGGACFCYGAWTLNPRVEAAGCALLAATFYVVCAANVISYGVTASPSIVWQMFVAVGFSLRFVAVLRAFPRERS